MKRRVNIKFLIILTLVVVGLGVAAIVAKKLGERPDKYVKAGDKYMQEKSFEKAAQSYGIAFGLGHQRDLHLLMLQGEAWYKLGQSEPAYVARARACWSKALEIDHQYVPALQRYLQFYEDARKQIGRGPQMVEVLTQIRDYATRLAEADPSNKEAAAKVPMTVIQAWLANVATDPKTVDAAMASLQKLAVADPSNPEIPFTLSQAYLRKARDASEMVNVTAVDAAQLQAAKVMDAALKGQEKNGTMHLRAAQIYDVLGHAARKDDARQQYKDKGKAELAQAVALLSPKDANYVDSVIMAGMMLGDSGDMAGAEKLLGAAYEQQPTSAALRLAYARVLSQDPAKQPAAMELLTKPWSDARADVSYHAQGLMDLIRLQLQQSGEAKNADDKDKALNAAEDTLKQLAQIYPSDSPTALRFQGQLQLLRGKQTEAIQTLARAQSLLQQNGARDPELYSLLATAYLQARQTGDAEKLLRQVVRDQPDAPGPRRVLATIYLQQGDVNAAAEQVRELERLLPKDPDVTRQKIAVLVMQKQPAQAQKLFDQLPEGTTREKMSKAQVALGLEKYDEAVRLLESVRHEDAKNTMAVRMLVTAYRGRNDIESARRVVDEAVQANPSDVLLLGMRKELSGASAEEMKQYTREVAEKNPDPFMREMQLSMVAAYEGKQDEALQHLRQAEQIKPDDTRVQEQLFQAYLADGKWELAGQYADKLSTANADRAGGSSYQFRLLLAQRKYDQALKVATSLTQKMPEFAQSWVMLAQGQEATGNLDAAVTSYQRALEKQTDNDEAMRGLMDCYYKQNRPDDALRMIKQAERMFPASNYFHELEIRHTLQYGDPIEAVADWETARKQNPDNRSAWVNLAQAYSRAAQARTTPPADVKRYMEALGRLCDEGIKKWPDERRFYAFQADLASQRKDMDGGVAVLQKLAAVPAWKDKPEPWLMLAEYYAHFNKADEAEQALRTAMTKGPDDTAARQGLARLQAATGRLKDAIATLAPKSSNPAIAEQLLELQINARQYDAAEQLGRSLLASNPGSAPVLNALVRIYAGQGQFDKALALVNQTLASDPNNAAALYGRGLVEMQQSKPDFDAAIRDLRAARDKNPGDVDARFWLAEAYRSKNDYDSAIRELNAAITVQPNNKVLRLRLVAVCQMPNPPHWLEAENTLKEARQIPDLAPDPDLAVAETRMWIARRQADRAVEVGRQALTLTHGNPQVIQAYLDAMIAAGNYQALLDETEKLTSQSGAPFWIYQDRGVAKARLGQKEQALAEFEKALNNPEARQNDAVSQAVLTTLAHELGVDQALAQVAPKADGNPRWQMVQAYLYQQKHDYPSAIASLEKAMSGLDKMPPADRVNLLQYAGSLYLEAEPTPMVDKALDAFKRSLKEAPDNISTLNNVASILTDFVEPARPQEALEYSQRAYDLMMKSGRIEPLILDTQGRVLTMVGRVEEGLVLLQDAATRTDIPDVQYHLAEAYLKKQAPEEAQKHLTQASAAIDRAKKERASFDPKMAAKIEALKVEAKRMIEARTQQAGAR